MLLRKFLSNKIKSAKKSLKTWDCQNILYVFKTYVISWYVGVDFMLHRYKRHIFFENHRKKWYTCVQMIFVCMEEW